MRGIFNSLKFKVGSLKFEVLGIETLNLKFQNLKPTKDLDVNRSKIWWNKCWNFRKN